DRIIAAEAGREAERQTRRERIARAVGVDDPPRQRGRREATAGPGEPTLPTERLDDEPRRRLDVARLVWLARITAAADERVELDAGAPESLVRARCRDQHPGGARRAQRAHVAAREVDGVGVGELGPRQAARA